MSGETQHELYCGSCGWSSASLPSFVQRLQAAGLLKRNADASEAEVRELTAQLIDKLTCPDCGGRLVLDEVDDWPSAQNCEFCSKPISAERLEVFPDAKVCVACQQLEESGQTSPDAIDFCPRCGSPMTMRMSGGGVTRYRMQCTSPGCRAKL